MGGFIVAAALAAATAGQTTDCSEDPAIAWSVVGGFATFKPAAAVRGDTLLDAIAREGGHMQPAAAGAEAPMGRSFQRWLMTAPRRSPTFVVFAHRVSEWWNARRPFRLGQAPTSPSDPVPLNMPA